MYNCSHNPIHISSHPIVILYYHVTLLASYINYLHWTKLTEHVTENQYLNNQYRVAMLEVFVVPIYSYLIKLIKSTLDLIDSNILYFFILLNTT